jgi:hypothetical protein
MTTDMVTANANTSADARKEIGKLIDAAHYAGQHTILAKNDEPRAVLVPYRWYIEQQKRPG